MNSTPVKINPARSSQANTTIQHSKWAGVSYQNLVEDYLSRYSPIAIQEMNQYGVPASIILAQGIHESGAGKSTLALNANNHFGVKCTSDWTGPGFHMNDDKPNECFRSYHSPEESFSDHMSFLQRKRYATLFALGSKDYKAWAYGLKACGYATNTQYPQILINLIEKYKLYQYDGSSSPWTDPIVKNPGTKPTYIVYDTVHQKVIKVDTIYTYTYPKDGPPHGNKLGTRDSNLYAGNPSNRLSDNPNNAYNSNRIMNSRPTNYTVKQGDTLYGVARRFNITVEELKSMNNILDNSLKIDQVIKVAQ